MSKFTVEMISNKKLANQFQSKIRSIVHQLNISMWYVSSRNFLLNFEIPELVENVTKLIEK